MIHFLISSLRFYRRSHIGVLLGTMLATAVLTGSLLVGDSMDGSLRKVALQRLGKVTHAMHTPNRFFRAALAERVAGGTAALLHLRGMALVEDRQVNQVQVYGCDSMFGHFAGVNLELAENETALNRKLARSLGVGVGDEVSLRIEKPGVLPADAPLSSQNSDRTVRARFRVVRILDRAEMGGFSLSANQAVPYNAFVNRTWLGEHTALGGKANLLLAATDDPARRLTEVWEPEDFGFRFRNDSGVVQLESATIYLEPEAARAALEVKGAEGSLTYLVNSISKDEKSTPYSFVLAAGMDLAEDEIKINQWLADELEAEIGDPIGMNYFELQSSSRFVERTQVFKVHSIVSMSSMELERLLAPQFPGLTDVDRCADWDVGIPMEEEQLEDESNEAYWNEFKQTPKAIVSLKDGQQMWSNRFGSFTGIRWSNGGNEKEAFRAAYKPETAGYIFLPVREQALSAVDNAMDFGQLFAGMSFFLIVSSLMLTGLLFVFGIQERAEEMGILLATGWRPRTVRTAVLAEGGMIAFAGALAGAVLGIGYTAVLINGLSSHWKGAVAGSAIELFVSPSTVAAGAVTGFLCALIAMGFAVWRQTRQSAHELLTVDFSQEFSCDAPEYQLRWMCVLPWLLLMGAVGIAAYALLADVHSITMPFFGAGSLLLISGILFFRNLLGRFDRMRNIHRLGTLGLLNVTRRKGRSLTVVGLLACGCFLTFAVASMQEDVTAHADNASSGTGGFAWFGESTLPVKEDIGGVRLRVRDGDDASCLNLNHVQSPRLLGVEPQSMSERQAFLVDEDLWLLLTMDLPDGVIPGLIGDADTAMWGMKARTGIENGDLLDYIDEAGKPFKVKLVGHLPMRLSVFQGSVLISEQNFAERFPSEEGWRMFLLDTPVESRNLSRAGFDLIPATERLLEFYAVESTYLAMFLVLGALGLVVGTMGMGVVVLRNIQDRRTELALLRAVGYKKIQLRKLLFIEHGLLLTAGLGIGVLSSALAMVPAVFLLNTKTAYGFMTALFLLVVLCSVVFICMAILFSEEGKRPVTSLSLDV